MDAGNGTPEEERTAQGEGINTCDRKKTGRNRGGNDEKHGDGYQEGMRKRKNRTQNGLRMGQN